MDNSTGCIVFRCHKCEGTLTMRFAATEDAVNLAKRMKGLIDKDCPFCGEEPYDNWIVYDVILPSNGGT